MSERKAGKLPGGRELEQRLHSWMWTPGQGFSEEIRFLDRQNRIKWRFPDEYVRRVEVAIDWKI